MFCLNQFILFFRRPLRISFSRLRRSMLIRSWMNISSNSCSVIKSTSLSVTYGTVITNGSRYQKPLKRKIDIWAELNQYSQIRATKLDFSSFLIFCVPQFLQTAKKVCHVKLPHSFAGRCFFEVKLRKQHNLFNPHSFRPSDFDRRLRNATTCIIAGFFLL